MNDQHEGLRKRALRRLTADASALQREQVVLVPRRHLDRLVGLAELTDDRTEEEDEAVEWGAQAIYDTLPRSTPADDIARRANEGHPLTRAEERLIVDLGYGGTL